MLYLLLWVQRVGGENQCRENEKPDKASNGVHY
jgi:hypothetical protein